MFFATRVFTFILLSLPGIILCHKIPCDFEDNECLTNSIRRVFKEFISGVRGVNPSDPLCQNLIVGDLPTIKYVFNNATLSGMSNCDVELMRISLNEHKYIYNIRCPHLLIKAGYEIKGDLGPVYLEGKDKAEVNLIDYRCLFSGDLGTKESEDGKLYLYLKNHELQLESEGTGICKFKNLFHGDTQKSYQADHFLHENWHFVDRTLRQPTMDSFMNVFIANFNDYLKQVPAQELFYY